MDSVKHKEVPVEKLRWQCDPEALGFNTTDEIKCCDEIIGQERALKAIKLGLDVKSPGYNIFVAGFTGGSLSDWPNLLSSRAIRRSHLPPSEMCRTDHGIRNGALPPGCGLCQKG